MSDVRFDDRLGRYRDARGRFVSNLTVRAGVDKTIAHASQIMYDTTRTYRSTTMSLGEWQQRMRREIKLVHVAAALAAHGGVSQMTPSMWGRVGAIVRQQYGYLTRFTADVLDGRQRMNGRMDVRAAQYGAAARVTFENLRAIEQRLYGARYERNVLHARESCVGCKAATDLGSVPLGTLPAIGSRQCRSRCRCTLEYSAKPAELDVYAPLSVAV